MGIYLPVTFNPDDPLFVRSMGLEDNPELAHWGPGYRKYCILHFVTKGSGFFQGHPVHANEGFFIDGIQLHEYHSDPNDPWNYFWIIFSKEAAERYILPLLPIKNGIFSYPFRENLLRHLQRFFHENDILSHTEGLAFFFELISRFREHDEKHDLSTAAIHIRKAKTFIDRNFNKKITVRDTAAAIHLNERYLYLLFIQQEHISPKAYIDRKRLQTACELLENTSLSISEIACSLGFSDVCTFSKFFSAKLGNSPSSFRNHTQNPPGT